LWLHFPIHLAIKAPLLKVGFGMCFSGPGKKFFGSFLIRPFQNLREVPGFFNFLSLARFPFWKSLGGLDKVPNAFWENVGPA